MIVRRDRVAAMELAITFAKITLCVAVVGLLLVSMVTDLSPACAFPNDAACATDRLAAGACVGVSPASCRCEQTP